MQDHRSMRLPPWFNIRLGSNKRSHGLERLVSDNKLHTVCQSAACPNKAECWSEGTATFMILGDVCTRGCGFCNVPRGKPDGLDIDEPQRVARTVAALKLDFAVITSVTRDDLPDGGAGIFAATIRAIRSLKEDCSVEVLIPDFQGSETALATVLSAHPDILNHNVETVPSLYGVVRPQAVYPRSIELLRRANNMGFTTKTGLILGLGEGLDEVRSVLGELRSAGCDILTLGQYLRPGKKHLPVKKYYHPDEFESLKAEAERMGFRKVRSGPLVRSSYHARHDRL
jgi:lipoic acid synthetase